MPQLKIPSDVKQKKMLKACAKEGLRLENGKGSHVKVFNAFGKFTVVQYNLNKQSVRRLLKQLEALGVKAEKIIKHLMF